MDRPLRRPARVLAAVAAAALLAGCTATAGTGPSSAAPSPAAPSSAASTSAASSSPQTGGPTATPTSTASATSAATSPGAGDDGVLVRGTRDDASAMLLTGCRDWPDLTGALVVTVVGGTRTVVSAQQVEGGRATREIARCLIDGVTPADVARLGLRPQVQRLDRESFFAEAPQFSVDGGTRRLALSSDPGDRLWVLDLRSGRVSPAPASPRTGGPLVGWTTAGPRWLAAPWHDTVRAGTTAQPFGGWAGTAFARLDRAAVHDWVCNLRRPTDPIGGPTGRYLPAVAADGTLSPDGALAVRLPDPPGQDLDRWGWGAVSGWCRFAAAGGLVAPEGVGNGVLAAGRTLYTGMSRKGPGSLTLSRTALRPGALVTTSAPVLSLDVFPPDTLGSQDTQTLTVAALPPSLAAG